MVVSRATCLRADEAVDREYRIKAAFVYNFLKFVDGGRFTPKQEKKKDEIDPNDSLVVGILGVPPSRVAFEELQGKQIGNRLIIVRWFRGFEALAGEDKTFPKQHPDFDAIRACHVLVLCPSEKAFLSRILTPLRASGVLTVGDVPSFLESGGVINLLIEDRKVRFEINLAAAVRARLTIRSSLLRLAVRTIEHDQLELAKAGEHPDETARP
ncbi:MAG TPA: YfiR family protein [Sedimentisphaerales bacterium]|nr:YfiR family protein [Sedimentisphaerales bacterium]HNU31147.1 YfiR family protein [Sedimentisphaerales bacterium]